MRPSAIGTASQPGGPNARPPQLPSRPAAWAQASGEPIQGAGRAMSCPTSSRIGAVSAARSRPPAAAAPQVRPRNPPGSSVNNKIAEESPTAGPGESCIWTPSNCTASDRPARATNAQTAAASTTMQSRAGSVGKRSERSSVTEKAPLLRISGAVSRASPAIPAPMPVKKVLPEAPDGSGGRKIKPMPAMVPAKARPDHDAGTARPAT